VFADAFFARGVLDVAHEGRSVQADLVPSVVVEAVVRR
jgi:hypothetical protein